MRVLKFGGSSVGSPARIGGVIEILRSYSFPLVVVVSAFEKVTDVLLEVAATAARGDASYEEKLKQLETRHRDTLLELVSGARAAALLKTVDAMLEDLRNVVRGIYLVREVSSRTQDVVVSFGERLSAEIVAGAAAQQLGAAQAVDARKLIVTDARFGSAQVQWNETRERVRTTLLSASVLPIVTGFIGATRGGETTTLGRGGSDYTASILGAALEAEEIEIWTDVDGVLTCDPRRVKQAFPIAELTYQEAAELSHFGAKVIFPPTMQPAMRAGIPLRIKNTFNPSCSGTLIKASRPAHSFPVTGISSLSHVAVVRLSGIGLVGAAGTLSRIFESLGREGISVILVTQASSEYSICFAIEPKYSERVRELLDVEFAPERERGLIDPIVIEKEHAVVAAVGENMRHTPGIAGKMFTALGRNGVNVVAIAQGSSELNISAVVARESEAKALQALHDAFFLSHLTRVPLFVCGTGKIATEFLAQIRRQAQRLREDHKLDLRVAGMLNRRTMLVDANGIDPERWTDTSGKAGAESVEPSLVADLGSFVRQMIDLNLSHSIFVDCSASDEVAACYEQILHAAIAVVTPNKRANSGSLERYRTLRNLGRRGNVRYYYETTVGAGLPVIGTLNDLLLSGDEILSIDAVLSGTLSFLFNSFGADRSFSALVEQARSRGYTEPDPRDDLSGADVARKVLILAREMGLPLEPESVTVESLVPPALRDVSVEEFMQSLGRFDEEIAGRLAAGGSGSKLAYLASVTPSGASVGLRAVKSDDPFFHLSGSDNMIVFRTKRYSERPLVVRGPGAGVEVTAAGVFADVVRAAGYQRGG